MHVPWDLPLTLLAAHAHDGLAGWYLRETKSLPYAANDFVKLLYLGPSLPVPEPDPDRPGEVFPRVGWATLRSGWEEGGTLIVLQCSSANQGHSHQIRTTCSSTVARKTWRWIAGTRRPCRAP